MREYLKRYCKDVFADFWHWLGGAFVTVVGIIMSFFSNAPSWVWGLMAFGGLSYAQFHAWLIADKRRDQEKERADRLQSQIDSKADVKLDIIDAYFDANGPTEMYVDCNISNILGRPTILKNWVLEIVLANGNKYLYSPRHTMTGRTYIDPDKFTNQVQRPTGALPWERNTDSSRRVSGVRYSVCVQREYLARKLAV
jgi:hypothetical protein